MIILIVSIIIAYKFGFLWGALVFFAHILDHKTEVHQTCGCDEDSEAVYD